MSRKLSPVRSARAGFTLVELLVVIAIIGILAALTTAAVQRVRAKGKELQVREDLTNLDTAIGSFRAKMSNTPIPSGGGGPNGTFRLCTDYPAATDAWPEKQILLRMFPRMSTTDNGLRVPSSVTQTNTGTLISYNQPVLLDGNQCMVFFLSGGRFTEYNGFASDPFMPFLTQTPPGIPGAPAVSNWERSSPKRLNNGAFFEFKPTKMVAPNAYNPNEHTQYGNASPKLRFANDAAGRGLDEPWFIDPWGHPYFYWASTNGNDYSSTAVQIGPWGGQYSFRGAGNGPTPFRDSANKFTAPKGHQIVSMGADQKLGIGGQYTPNSGEYLGNEVGSDDFANFRQFRLGASGSD
jgi:prepilin-type N-terminal cleavage/methylation domain-containing protein